jgi:hypothetical protein
VVVAGDEMTAVGLEPTTVITETRRAELALA